MKIKKIFVLLSVLLLVASVTVSSCSTNSKNEQQSATTADSTDLNDGNGTEDIQSAKNTEEADAGYDFPELDFGGEDFNFLNVTTEWDFYTDIVKEEPEGEVLSDAIYDRNRLIEEKFNLNLTETGILITQFTSQLKKVILSGEDLYDAVYCPGWDTSGATNTIGSLVTSNMFHNLKDIPEMQLDQYWWNQNITRDSLIGDFDALYFAGCDINIMNLQGAWCVYFNEDMFKNLGMELPYEKVKEGKWTLDEFYSCIKAGTQLNGDDDFATAIAKWNTGGASVFGVTSYEYGIGALVSASGEKYIVKNEDKMPQLAIENERFLNVCEKVASIAGTKGEYQNANDYASGFHFEMIFRDNRAALMIGELKAADVFRNMESVYGIVPLPKYDETQQDYHTIVHPSSPLLVIPVTNDDLSRTGAVLDALAYVSHKDVTPVFYDITLSLKRLNNEDSIEMLKIIRDSVSVELGITFGWTIDFVNKVNTDLDKGKNTLVSLIEKNKAKIESNISKTMEYFEN